VALQGGRPPGDAAPNLWLTPISSPCASKAIYRGVRPAAESGFKSLVLGLRFDDTATERERGRSPTPPEGPEGDQRLLHRRAGRHLAGFRRAPRTMGRRRAASWIYCGGLRRRTATSPRKQRTPPKHPPARKLEWGWAWPATAASCTTAPRPMSRASRGVEAEKVDLVGTAEKDGIRRPELAPNKAPGSKAAPGANRARRAIGAASPSS